MTTGLLVVLSCCHDLRRHNDQRPCSSIGRAAALHTVTKGDVTVLKVAAALAERGERILMPFSSNERYDLALDRSGALFRVQCKTGRLKNGAVTFNTCSSTAHHVSGTMKQYVGDIEAFGVYCPQTNNVYLVPIADVSHVKRMARLRVDPTKNGQAYNVRHAAIYLVA